MKKGLVFYFFIVVGFAFCPAGVAAQHFLSVQSVDNLAFAANVNGINFNSSKSGLLRVTNLSAGTYNILISFTGNKYPTQNFNCVIGKSDESFTLKNLGQAGWQLKNIKSGQVIHPLQPVLDGSKEVAAQPNAFGQMLAEVAGDTDLLKPTVWVYTNKTDGTGAGASVANTQPGEDTANDVAATKGVIKVSEEEVKGGKELVFYDFNPNGGDTIHLMIPVADTAVNAPSDTLKVAQNNVSTDTTGALKPPMASQPMQPGDSVAGNKLNAGTATGNITGSDSAALGNRVQKPIADTALAFDTSSNRQFSNPFFKKDSGVSAPPGNTAFVDTSHGALPVAQQPADTGMQKPVATPQPGVDTSLQKTGAAPATAADSSGKRATVTSLPPADTSQHSNAASTAIAADTSLQKPLVASGRPPDTSQQKPVSSQVLLVRGDCNNMLNDNGAEKLKHKIFLETDENKMVEIAKKYLNSKCITVEQVKGLAAYFQTDDGRLNLFKALYPLVYDYGNFGSLESYMVDKNYKDMFRAILK